MEPAKARNAHEHPSRWAVILSAEHDGGDKPGMTSDMAAKLRALKRANRELRQANEILRSSSVMKNFDRRRVVDYSSPLFTTPSRPLQALEDRQTRCRLALIASTSAFTCLL
jgi:hypothetical protein